MHVPQFSGEAAPLCQALSHRNVAVQWNGKNLATAHNDLFLTGAGVWSHLALYGQAVNGLLISVCLSSIYEYGPPLHAHVLISPLKKMGLSVV